MAHEKRSITQRDPKAFHKALLLNKHVFTDREEPRNIFWERYKKLAADMDSGSVSVLGYYGVGGIGKTTLLKQIEIELLESAPTTKTLYWNFEEDVTPIEVVNRMKNILVEKYNFNFTLFELGYYHYKQNSGVNLPENQKKKLLGDNSTLGLVLDVAETVPVAETAVKLFKLCGNIVGKIRDVIESNPTIPEEIDAQKTPENLVKYLLNLFAEEMCKNLAKEEAPFVFLLDTYEVFVNENANGEIARKEDLWLRENSNFNQGIIWKIPNAMWVLAGRESLKWNEEDDAWDESELLLYSLGDFSERDSISYLQNSVGLTDVELGKALYKLTKGTPVYLSACADLFVQLKNSDRLQITIDDFGKSSEELVLRFLRNLPVNKIRIVQMLSCLKTFNDEIIKDLGPKVISQFDMDAYEEVKKLSFIVRISDGYMVHSTFSDVLFADKSCAEMCKKIYEPGVKAVKTFSKGTDAASIFKLRILPAIIKQFDGKDKDVVLWNSELAEALNDMHLCRESVDQYKKTIALLNQVDASIEWKLIQKAALHHATMLIYISPLRNDYEVLQHKTEQIGALLELLKEKKKNKFFSVEQELVLIQKMQLCKDTIYADEINSLKKEAAERYWKHIVNQGVYKETIEQMEKFPLVGFRMSKDKEIVFYYKQLIEKYKAVLGENSDEEINHIKKLAQKLYRMIDYADMGEEETCSEECLFYYKLLQEKYRTVLGLNSEPELKIIPTIGRLLKNLERNEECVKLFDEYYEKYKVKFGICDPRTVDFLETLIESTPNSYKKDGEKIEFNKEKYILDFFNCSMKKWQEDGANLSQKLEDFISIGPGHHKHVSDENKKYFATLLLNSYEEKYETIRKTADENTLLELKKKILNNYVLLEDEHAQKLAKRDIVNYCLNTESDLVTACTNESRDWYYIAVLEDFAKEGDLSNRQVLINKLLDLPNVLKYNKLFGAVAIAFATSSELDISKQFQEKYLNSYDFTLTNIEDYDVEDDILFDHTMRDLIKALKDDGLAFKNEFEKRLDENQKKRTPNNSIEKEVDYFKNLRCHYKKIGSKSRERFAAQRIYELRYEKYGDDSSVMDNLLEYAEYYDSKNPEEAQTKLALYQKYLDFYKERNFDLSESITLVKMDAADIYYANNNIEQCIEMIKDCSQYFVRWSEDRAPNYEESDYAYKKWRKSAVRIAADLLSKKDYQECLNVIRFIESAMLLNGDFSISGSEYYGTDSLENNDVAREFLRITNKLASQFNDTGIIDDLFHKILDWKENENFKHLSIEEFRDTAISIFLEE